MPRYVAKIEYDGRNFVGYQVQPNGPSIQAEIERVLNKIGKTQPDCGIRTSCSGRTDSGVHALGQVIHFDFPFSIEERGLLKAMNSVLDPAIRVLAIRAVAPDFHARYMAKEKTYLYRIDTSPFPDPFKRFYTLHHPYEYDLKRMQQALEAIVGQHDFTSFCSTHTDKEDKVREVLEASIDYQTNCQELRFYIRGRGFLYNMVRIIVGTLLQIGDGLKPVDELERLLQVKDRNQAGPTADPAGLYLYQVCYDHDPFV